MADAAGWPDADELKRVLNVESDAHDESLQATLDAAIEKVKLEVGAWDDESDVPTIGQNRAALRMAILMAQAGATPESAERDSIYRAHLFGSRRRFAVA